MTRLNEDVATIVLMNESFGNEKKGTVWYFAVIVGVPGLVPNEPKTAKSDWDDDNATGHGRERLRGGARALADLSRS